MVHCYCEAARSKEYPDIDKRGDADVEFFKNGEPQVYCRGYYDLRTDETLDVCKNCPDFVLGEQCQKDWEEAKKNGELTEFIPEVVQQKTKNNVKKYNSQWCSRDL